MMTSVGSNAERDRWVEVLGLSPQLVAFMMQEHSVKQDNRAPLPAPTPEVWAKQRPSDLSDFFTRALRELDAEDEVEDLIHEMRDKGFPSDVNTLSTLFVGTTDVGIIIEDALRFPHVPLNSTAKMIAYTANWLGRVLPEIKDDGAAFNAYVGLKREPATLWLLEGLKMSQQSFERLGGVYEEQDYKALAIISSSLADKSQATFDYHVKQAEQRKDHADNILKRYLSYNDAPFKGLQ
jgi:hypothetical protein